MYHTALKLTLSLFTVYLANKCWAQEAALTTETPELIVPSPSSDNNTSITTNAIGDFTTYMSSEVPTTVSESTSPDLISEHPFSNSASEPTFTDRPPEPSSIGSNPQASSDFSIHIDRDILQECDTVLLEWSGEDITLPYRIFYSKGTGDIGDTSILTEEIDLGSSIRKSFQWYIPATWKSK
jgi:hypothetical protein